MRLSDYFNLDPKHLGILGVLDPTLNVDTRLFIDPLLLINSRHAEISSGAHETYEGHFAKVIKLLRGSRSAGDVAWRAAERSLSFPEIKWTCLGYGAASVSGSGSGSDLTAAFTRTAKEIVDLGIDDPDLFVAMALFEEGFGPDRISDMTTNVILGDLLKFNDRILESLSIPRKPTVLRLRNGNSYNAVLPINPFVKGSVPVVLVPADVLRDLPVAKDWSEIADAAAKNADVRNQVNNQIAKIWEARTLKDKEGLREWAMSGRHQFETFLEVIHGANPTPYDMAGDPIGELFWRDIAATLAEREPFQIKRPAQLDLKSVSQVVRTVIDQFGFLIEKRRYSEELYYEGMPRPEKAAQRLFFAVAHAYCKANNLDITPEADTGNGPVDFKVSSGYVGRVLVEIKLSTNTKLVSGYSRQLESYKTAEETLIGYYVVIDVGKMGRKAKRLIGEKNAAAARRESTSEIVFIDGARKKSASKL